MTPSTHSFIINFSVEEDIKKQVITNSPKIIHWVIQSHPLTSSMCGSGEHRVERVAIGLIANRLHLVKVAEAFLDTRHTLNESVLLLLLFLLVFCLLFSSASTSFGSRIFSFCPFLLLLLNYLLSFFLFPSLLLLASLLFASLHFFSSAFPLLSSLLFSSAFSFASLVSCFCFCFCFSYLIVIASMCQCMQQWVVRYFGNKHPPLLHLLQKLNRLLRFSSLKKGKKNKKITIKGTMSSTFPCFFWWRHHYVIGWVKSVFFFFPVTFAHAWIINEYVTESGFKPATEKNIFLRKGERRKTFFFLRSVLLNTLSLLGNLKNLKMPFLVKLLACSCFLLTWDHSLPNLPSLWNVIRSDAPLDQSRIDYLEEERKCVHITSLLWKNFGYTVVGSMLSSFISFSRLIARWRRFVFAHTFTRAAKTASFGTIPSEKQVIK